MKIDAEIKKDLIKNMVNWKENVISSIDAHMASINHCETVEDLMKVKKRMVIAYLGGAPISGNLCYFCIHRRAIGGFFYKCKQCEYAQFHGVCVGARSDWSRISRRLKKLTDFVNARYYRGEVYGKKPWWKRMKLVISFGFPYVVIEEDEE